MSRWAALLLLAFTAQASDQGRIFVYAQRETPARSWLTVTLDGKPCADIKRGYFFTLNVDAGRHTIALGQGIPLTIEVRHGEDSFVRLDWNHGQGRGPIAKFSRATAERARSEMRFLAYIDAERARAPETARSDARAPEQPRLRVEER